MKVGSVWNHRLWYVCYLARSNLQHNLPWWGLKSKWRLIQSKIISWGMYVTSLTAEPRISTQFTWNNKKQIWPSTFPDSRTSKGWTESDMYDVLKRANLLSYNKKFYAQGIQSPHDVLKANKEEFNHIMRLVGMASTPGHAIGFKRSLNEWAEEKGTILNSEILTCDQCYFLSSPKAWKRRLAGWAIILNCL